MSTNSSLYSHVKQMTLEPSLTSRKRWIDLEVHRRLLESNSLPISMMLRLSLYACMAMYAPIYIVTIWLLASVGIRIWMAKLSHLFTLELDSKPHSMSDQMRLIASKYTSIWTINFILWGISPFIFITWLPHINQLLCITILLFVNSITIAKTHMHRRIMHRLITILFYSQLLALIFHFLVIATDPEQHKVYYALYGASLIFIYYVHLYFGNKLFTYTRQYLNSVYTNLLNVQKLKRATIQSTETFKLLCHDIRAPQSSILILVRTGLLNDSFNNKEFQDLCSKITFQVHTTLALADNSIWQYNLNPNNLQLFKLDLVQLLHEVTDRAAPIAQSKQIKLVHDFKCDNLLRNTDVHESDFVITKDNVITNLWIDIEPHLVSRAIFNLVENAIKFSYEQTTVQIGLRIVPVSTDIPQNNEILKPKYAVNIIVKDQGCGIQEKDLPYIFNAYKQFRNIETYSDLHQFRGYGLGLKLVKSVSELHRGDVHCYSVPNEGTTFVLELPIQQ